MNNEICLREGNELSILGMEALFCRGLFLLASGFCLKGENVLVAGVLSRSKEYYPSSFPRLQHRLISYGSNSRRNLYVVVV